MNILLIDNYDSFTYNLYQLLAKGGARVKVCYNDIVHEDDLEQAQALVISPGPGRPSNAGRCVEVVRAYAGRLPMLGVCLGHQVIVEAFGGSVVRAKRLMHGKTSRIYHDGESIYAHMPNPLEVGRYHSLVVEEADVPSEFDIVSYTQSGEVMGIRHCEMPIEGVQFHPESILTPRGEHMLRRFVEDASAACSV